MPVITAGDSRLKVSVDRPETWFLERKCVPKLRVPRELFGLSNRPIVAVPNGLVQPRPLIANLDPGAVFVWCYYQAPGDPNPDEHDPTPDYSGNMPPLQYQRSEVFPAHDAREWKRGVFLWRRTGFYTGSVAVSVFVWEGINVSHEDIQIAERVVSTVTPV